MTLLPPQRSAYSEILCVAHREGREEEGREGGNERERAFSKAFCSKCDKLVAH